MLSAARASLSVDQARRAEKCVAPRRSDGLQSQTPTEAQLDCKCNLQWTSAAWKWTRGRRGGWSCSDAAHASSVLGGKAVGAGTHLVAEDSMSLAYSGTTAADSDADITANTADGTAPQ